MFVSKGKLTTKKVQPADISGEIVAERLATDPRFSDHVVSVKPDGKMTYSKITSQMIEGKIDLEKINFESIPSGMFLYMDKGTIKGKRLGFHDLEHNLSIEQLKVPNSNGKALFISQSGHLETRQINGIEIEGTIDFRTVSVDSIPEGLFLTQQNGNMVGRKIQMSDVEGKLKLSQLLSPKGVLLCDGKTVYAGNILAENIDV